MTENNTMSWSAFVSSQEESGSFSDDGNENSFYLSADVGKHYFVLATANGENPLPDNFDNIFIKAKSVFEKGGEVTYSTRYLFPAWMLAHRKGATTDPNFSEKWQNALTTIQIPQSIYKQLTEKMGLGFLDKKVYSDIPEELEKTRNEFDSYRNIVYFEGVPHVYPCILTKTKAANGRVEYAFEVSENPLSDENMQKMVETVNFENYPSLEERKEIYESIFGEGKLNKDKENGSESVNDGKEADMDFG